MNAPVIELLRPPPSGLDPAGSAPESDGATTETPFAESLDSELEAESAAAEPAPEGPAPAESSAAPDEAEADAALADEPDLAPTAEMLAAIARELEEAEVEGATRETRIAADTREARTPVAPPTVPLDADEAAPNTNRAPLAAADARASAESEPTVAAPRDAETAIRDAATATRDAALAQRNPEAGGKNPTAQTGPAPNAAAETSVPSANTAAGPTPGAPSETVPGPAPAPPRETATSPATPDVAALRRAAAEARDAANGAGAPAPEAPVIENDATLRTLENASASGTRAATTPLPEPAAAPAPVAPAPTPPAAAPAPAAVASAAPQGTPAPADSVPMHVEWLAERGGGRARLDLHPPHLGRVELAVRLVGAEVQVTVVAHEPAAGTLLQSQRDQLAENLSARDLSLAEFEVADRDTSDPRDGAPRDELDPGFDGLDGDRGIAGDASLRGVELPSHTPLPRSGVDLRV